MIQIGNFVSKLYCLELLPLARFVGAVQEREGLTPFSPRLGRTPRIPPAWVAGAGTNIGGGTYEHIPR